MYKYLSTYCTLGYYWGWLIGPSAAAACRDVQALPLIGAGTVVLEEMSQLIMVVS